MDYYKKYNDNIISIDLLNNKIKIGDKLPPEVEEGNIEYKLKIDPDSEDRKHSLSAQLVWRMYEGKRLYNTICAYYIIGIYDDGTYGNLDIKSINYSIKNLKKIGNLANAKINNIKMSIINNSYIAICKITEIDLIKNKKEVNVLFVGNSGVGKSSIIGSLCYNKKNKINKYDNDKEFIINDVIFIPDIGTIVSGILRSSQ